MFTILRGGDIFNVGPVNGTTVIAHGVNIRGLQGAGFAAQVSSRFPEATRAYREVCLSGQLVAGGVLFTPTGIDGLVVAHVASQDDPGPHARIEWLDLGLSAMYRHIIESGLPAQVRMPLIGGGIGGLEPTKSIQTIQRVAEKFSTLDTTLYLIGERPNHG